MPSAASDLSLLEDAAREAGAIARAQAGRKVKTWAKGASIVSEVDLEIDTLLKRTLRAARPDYGWLSEETADTPDRLAHERIFIVDPIDGTRAFLAGQPDFTIALGIAENGRMIAGAVYAPIPDEMYLGSSGQGATLNGAPVRVTERTELEGASLLAKRKFIASGSWPQLKVSLRASAAYRLALAGAGRYDAALLSGVTHEWDVAAGVAIVEAAGGVVTNLTGAPLAFNQPAPQIPGVVAAGAPLHALILERLSIAPAKQDAAS